MRSEVLRNRAKKPPWGKALGLDFAGGRVASVGSKQKKRVSLIYRTQRTFCHMVQSSSPREDREVGRSIRILLQALVSKRSPPLEPGP